MLQFKVSEKANKDLFDIGLYTQSKYGIKQRNKYLDTIEKKFQTLVNNPELGMQQFNVRSNYYSTLIQEHIIFYKKFNYGIRIIRVLHQSIKLEKHL